MNNKYQILDIMGVGAFGTVVKATQKSSGETVAIKLIKQIQKDSYMLRKVIRELCILRKLSDIENNIYTSKVIEVILPMICFKNEEKS